MIFEHMYILESLTSEVTPSAIKFFKMILAILADYKHPRMLFLSLPPRPKVKKLDF